MQAERPLSTARAWHATPKIRSCQSQPRHTVVGLGGLQVDCSAPEQAGVGLRQEIGQQQGQMHELPDPVTPHDSSQVWQLSSNFAPQHRRAMNGEEPQLSHGCQQRRTTAGQGGCQDDGSAEQQTDAEQQQELVQQDGQLQDPRDSIPAPSQRPVVAAAIERCTTAQAHCQR